MYVQSFLRLVLLWFLISEYGTVQAEDSAVLFDEEAKLRAVQERRIES